MIPRRKEPLILIAEDDDDDKEFLMIAFHKVTDRHKVHVAANGQEALEYLSGISDEKELPCLIVLDLNMPVLNGLQTLEALKDKPKFEKIPKVIFTTSDNDSDKVRCLSQGATDYIVKPSNMSEIQKSIQSMLGYCS